MPSHAGSDRVPESRTSLRERQQGRRRRRRAVALRLMLTLIVTTTAAGSAWWWFQHDRVAGAEPEVTFMVAEPGPYQWTVPAPVTLRAATTVEVRTDRSGAVQWVAAIGTRVELDEVVARLEPGEFERDVRDAELALERSERALVAAHADLADVERSLSNALLEAERRLVRAQAALAAAERAAEREAFEAYVNVLERGDALREAATRAEIAAAQLAAAQVRFEAGVITGLALEEARSDAEAASRAARDAASAEELAWIDLAAVVGFDVDAMRDRSRERRAPARRRGAERRAEPSERQPEPARCVRTRTGRQGRGRRGCGDARRPAREEPGR